MSCRRLVPSTFCTETSELPVAVDTNATRVPSGESDEWAIASPGTNVIWRASAMLSIGPIQRFRLPLAVLLKSSVRPSRVTKIHMGSPRGPARRAGGSRELTGTLQTSRSCSTDTVTMRVPSAETLGALSPR